MRFFFIFYLAFFSAFALLTKDNAQVLMTECIFEKTDSKVTLKVAQECICELGLEMGKKTVCLKDFDRMEVCKQFFFLQYGARSDDVESTCNTIIEDQNSVMYDRSLAIDPIPVFD